MSDGLPPEPDPDPQSGPDTPQHTPQRGSGQRDSSGRAADNVEHDPTGLDLARQIARGVGVGTGRPRRKRPRHQQPQSSGAHPDGRDPQTLGKEMDRLMSERGWSKQVNVHLLLGRWAVLVGPINADHSSPESYRDAVLTVRADSTAWASQMRSFAPQLVAKLNAELGDGTVTRVIVKGPDAPSWKHGGRSVPGRGPRDTYG